MVFSLIFLFLFLLACSGVLFFFYGFFVPALKLRYDGIDEILSTEEYLNVEEVEIAKRKKEESDEFSKACLDANISFYATINSGIEQDNKSFLERRLFYKSEKKCGLFYNNYSSEYKNTNCCIGFGDCQTVCPQEAIIIQDGIARITSNCNGCGKCLDVCPINLITLTNEKPKFIKKYFKFWKNCYKIFNK